ncbi:hypothetical protein [Prosthecobacter sp.]|uniref:hypothetical protein n=1 Tax=Prosthecobacter sp. TaxID=1965333 RepID=UPI002AB905D9|nr:hypothetical protein [Prosthecobacter sp.]MDZ4403006.1 hypothetical protein [Prosthecobacter sp.]
MKIPARLPAFAALFLGALSLFGQTTDVPIDWDKAKQLHQRDGAGETLTPDEKTYLDKARAALAKGQGPGSQGQPASPGADGIDWPKAQQLFQRSQRGEKLNEEDQKYLDKALEARKRGGNRGGGGGGTGNQRKAAESLKPLSDMTADDNYEGEDGGLYGKGSNEPPEALQKAAADALAQIKPLDAEGKPSDSGKIVLVSISMSNATQEFSFFKRIADEDARKSGKLTIVDCAQGGQAMAQWVPEEARPWQEAMKRIQNAEVTPQQVQVAWVKLANVGPSGSKTEHLAKLEADTTIVLQNAKKRFPNLRIAYLGSRIWAGNATGGLNPEPYAYEGAFAVRHLIQKQISGDEALTSAKSPLLLWGPYLWAEGEKGRKLDDLKYVKDDFSGDGVHPSNSGREKVAKLLLEFFATSPLAKGWFIGK